MWHRLVMLAALTAFVADVSGATRYVATAANGGADTGNCTVTPCLTCDYAFNQAATGDTISIGAGTFTGETGLDLSKSVTFQGAGRTSTILTGPGSNGTIFLSGTVSGTTTINDLTVTMAASTSRALVYEWGTAANMSLAFTRVRFAAPASYTAGNLVQLANAVSGYTRTLTLTDCDVTCTEALPSTDFLYVRRWAGVTLTRLALPSAAPSVRSAVNIGDIDALTATGCTGKPAWTWFQSVGSVASTKRLYLWGNDTGTLLSGNDPNIGAIVYWSHLNLPNDTVIAGNTHHGHNDLVYIADPDARTATNGGRILISGNTLVGTGGGANAKHGVGPFDGAASVVVANNRIWFDPTAAATYGIVAKADNVRAWGNTVYAQFAGNITGGPHWNVSDPNYPADPNDTSGITFANNTLVVNQANGYALQIAKYNGDTVSWPINWVAMNNILDAQGLAGAYALYIDSAGSTTMGYLLGLEDNNLMRGGATYVANIYGSTAATVADLPTAWAAVTNGRALNSRADVAGAPRYRNLGANDLRLAPGSPGLGDGSITSPGYGASPTKTSTTLIWW